MNVLVVEDEERVASFLIKGLRAHGYAVEHAETGADALARAPAADLVILDLGLPDIDGMEILQRLRASGAQVPVIVLTARSDVHHRVEGLDLGADDYLTKPFAFDELLARLRARLRRGEGEPSAVLRAGKARLDLRTRQAWVEDRRVDLSAKEFALFETFMRHAGQVLSREQLLSQVWDYDFDPQSNVVDVAVANLRRKVGGEVIQTIRGAGYRLLNDGS